MHRCDKIHSLFFLTSQYSLGAKREREQIPGVEKERDRGTEQESASVCVCGCVCMCVRDREAHICHAVTARRQNPERKHV